MNFHNFSPDPPPKSCENPIFFSPMTQKTFCANEEKFSLENPKYLEKSQYLVENYLSFQSILSVRGTLTPFKKIFIADMDELEHAKKNK